MRPGNHGPAVIQPRSDRRHDNRRRCCLLVLQVRGDIGNAPGLGTGNWGRERLLPDQVDHAVVPSFPLGLTAPIA